MDKVSVVLCVFNGEKYVKKSICSILEQTYENLELIICNDGSTDNTKKIIEEIAALDHRVKIIHKENEGLTKSLNLALSKVTGEWVARQDADDVSDKRRIEKQLDFCKRYGIDFCTSKASRFKDSGTDLGVVPNQSKRTFTKKVLKYGNLHVHGTFFFNVKVLNKFKYNESLKVAQDFNFILSAIDYGFKCELLNESLYKLRIHDDSISSRKRNIQVKSVEQSLRQFSLPTKYLIEGNSGLKRTFLSIFKRIECAL
ncbi:MULTISPECIES: glycosyltransferase family 2 protein [Vibrio harveyi group]|nr:MULTISPECIES: glycosyltransferase family 2 protein [Vibrio harveyi group]EJG1621134.1 glycosyltransferase family 2 protein [Vibrio parahaemolyticus]EKY4213227.1 glycosyltransferase family 2 protein [Vibrio alginolyticus]ELA7819884.1 glycosyltransferase family 2 protein [Vibrio alginolyticus]MDS1795608.1 glycosyltransferase family 2 protein [Vibrio parahaemolyticus]MDS1944096.1 glycosyltransferase family 2 protein [Vibrio parahaemolyticus]